VKDAQMSKLKASVFLAVGSSMLALAGCASAPPTSGDLMRGHGAEAQSQVDLKYQLAKDWDRGSQLVASGEKRLEAGERRVKDGQRDIKRGNREISEGQKLIQDSERRFREEFPGLDIKTGN
jgi:hypothetical protein